MSIVQKLTDIIVKITGFNEEYTRLTIISIFIILIYKLIRILIRKTYEKLPMNDKKKFYRNRNIQIVVTIILFIILFLLWGEKLEGLITIVSFISAGVAIAIREVIFNFFAGMYIKIRKPFEVEDRIEIDTLKGDVINIHALGFEMLEIGERIEGEQSTGRIAHIPNSYVLTKTLRNYTKAFKYIWDEMKLEITLDSNIKETEEILYEILFDNETLKEIPKKMEDAVDDIILEYRIYYNNLDPIIYKKIVDGHVELYLRYLVHPKNARNVQDEIYTRILEEYQKGRIKLIKED